MKKNRKKDRRSLQRQDHLFEMSGNQLDKECKVSPILCEDDWITLTTGLLQIVWLEVDIHHYG